MSTSAAWLHPKTMSKNNNPLKIVLYGVVVYDLLDTLRAKLKTPATITRLKENAPTEVVAKQLLEADVMIALKYQRMPRASKLRLLQIPGAGSDQINFDELPPHAAVCNAYGHDVAGGEYAVLAMLAWCHDFVPAHDSAPLDRYRREYRCARELRRAQQCVASVLKRAMIRCCRFPSTTGRRLRRLHDCARSPWHRTAPYRRVSRCSKFPRVAGTASHRSRP